MKKKGKKKLGKIIIISVCVLFVLALVGGGIYLLHLYGVGALNQHDNTAYAEERELLTYRAPFEADYIWIEENGVAVWAAFVKDIDLEKDEDTAVLDIACDTYYWLWINGEEIVWEGSLKRGVTPTDGFYDHVEIKNAFHAGNNRIAILVRHLGDDGYSHLDSGHGGLVVEGTIGSQPLMTDATWKAKKFAYQYNNWDFFKNLNYRLSERGSQVDGEAYTEFWREESVEEWGQAVVLDKQESEAIFGKSYLNPLPSKVIGDVVLCDLGGYDVRVDKKTTLTFDLGINTQFCPYFEFDADQQGRTITYYTENKYLNYENTYVAKQGENRFLDFAWISGEKLFVRVDKGITLRQVGYRPTGYGAGGVQAFTCEDEALSTLWQKAANTLAVTMRDSYMDCPDRERAQWIGDAVIESEMSVYSLTPRSAALFRKAIITTYGWIHRDGVIQSVVPDGVMAYELPMQNLAFLVGCADYVLYSGDESVTPMILSMAEGYLPLWEMRNNLVRHRKGSWDWGDWGNNVDVEALENAWYYYAMKRLLPLAEPESDFAAFCRERMSRIEEGYTAYYRDYGVGSGRKADDRANAVAVLAGLYREQDAEVILHTLYAVRNSSPYMEKYVEQALCVLGRVDLALARAKERYADMIADDCTTLWEFWTKSKGTTNHAWAGGTLTVLSRYVGGVYPTANGFASFVVEPNVEVMDSFEMAINPVDGVEIAVKAERMEGNLRKLTVVCSSEGGTLVVTGKNCRYNGDEVESAQSARREFVLRVGTNELIFE